MELKSQKSPAVPRQGSVFFCAPREMGCVFLISLVLVALYFIELLLEDVTFYSSDLVMFFAPFRQTWVEQVQQGIFPLWNPFTSSGAPLFATLQAGVLYPFSAFYFFLPFFTAFNVTLVLHYALAGFFMYLLVRATRCSRTGSALAGLTFMFGGYCFSLHQYLSTLFPVAWSPLLLLLYFAGLRRDDSRFAWAAALVAGFMLFAGGVETCYQLFPWMILFGLFPILIFPDESSLPPVRQRLGYMALFGLGFVGLTAVQWLPTWELTGLSTRAGGITLENAVGWSMKVKEWIQFVLLDPYGYLAIAVEKRQNQIWLKSLYTGAVPLLMALWFFLHGGRRAFTLMLIMALSLALALGDNTPLYPWFFEYIPLFDRFRFPVKFIFPFIFCLCLAFAWGWDEFNRHTGESPDVKKLARALCLTGATTAILGFGLIDFFEIPFVEWLMANGFRPPAYHLPHLNLDNMQRLLGLTGLFFFLLYFFLRTGRRGFRHAAVVVFFLDIFFSLQGSLLTLPLQKILAPLPEAQWIKKDGDLFRVYVSPDAERSQDKNLLFRRIRGMNMMGYPLPIALRNWPGIEHVDGWEVMRQREHKVFESFLRQLPWEKRLNLLRMANVKYVISDQETSPPPLKRVFINDQEPEPYKGQKQYEWRHIEIYENPGWLPRAYLVSHCLYASSQAQAFLALKDPRFNPEKTVILEAEEPVHCNPESPAETGGGTVEILERTPLEISMNTRADHPSWLFLSDSFYPGWKAEVDGEEVPIYKANVRYRAVSLSAGPHQVRFFYRPWTFYTGLAVSAGVGLVGVVSIPWITHRRKKLQGPVVDPG